MGRTVLTGSVALLLLATEGAAATPTTGVAIVTRRRDDPLVRRLYAELVSVSLRVALIERRAYPTSEAMLSIARSTRASATVALFGGRDAEIWLIDLARDKATVSDAVEQPRGPTDGAAMIRTAELLRARLLLRLPRSAIVETPRAMGPPPRDRVWLEAGGGAAFAPGGSLPMIGCAWVGAGWVTRPWLVLELTAMLPLHATQVDGPEGRADVFIGMVAAEARLLLRPDGVRVVPSLGLGIGAGFTRMRGVAIKPYESGDDWLTTMVAYGRPTVAVRLWRSLQLRFDGVIGVAVPRPVISFAGRTAAFWGRPLVAATLGLMVAL